jgi:hypothetical protein
MPMAQSACCTRLGVNHRSNGCPLHGRGQARAIRPSRTHSRSTRMDELRALQRECWERRRQAAEVAGPVVLGLVSRAQPGGQHAGAVGPEGAALPAAAAAAAAAATPITGRCACAHTRATTTGHRALARARARARPTRQPDGHGGPPPAALPGRAPAAAGGGGAGAAAAA